VVKLKSRTQSKYSGNKPSPPRRAGTLGEITVWIPISFKRTPAAKYLPATAGGQAKYNLEFEACPPQLGTLFIFPLTSTAWLMLITEFKAPPNVLIIFVYSVALILPVLVIPHTLIVMSEEVP